MFFCRRSAALSAKATGVAVRNSKRAGLAYRVPRDSGPVRPIGKCAASGSNDLVAWLVMLGIAMPSNLTFFLAGAKFTVARLVIWLLIFPGFAKLFRKGRHLGATDLFVFITCAGMLVAISQTDQSWSSTTALIIEFGGGYIVARSYFFGRPALEAFVRALKAVAIGLIALAAIEQATNYHIVPALFGLPLPGDEYRYGWLRAFSTFPHPILFGTFCASIGAIFLYSERGFLGRICYTCLCFFGCLLAMSSAPLMSFMIAISVQLYDNILRAFRSRWRILLAGLSALLLTVFLVANKPVSWIVANLTLDPSTGYFRVATWDTAFYYIGLSPYVGYGFDSYAPSDDFFGNVSVDSTWLVLTIRFGIPLAILLLLTNVASFARGRSTDGRLSNDPYVDNLCTGFTLTLVVLMFVGLTVHYWNNVWLFWGVCIGIRASLQEHCLKSRVSPILDDQSYGYDVYESDALATSGSYAIHRQHIRPLG
jgi:hypothetical protein